MRAHFRRRGLQKLADEVKQIFLHHTLHGFVVISVNLHVRHILDGRLVLPRSLAHFVQELGALGSSTAPVQDRPVRAHLPSARLACLGRIVLAKHAGDEVQELSLRVHVLDGASLNLIDKALVGTVLTVEGDRSVGHLHVSIAERHEIQLEVLFELSERWPQLAKNEFVAVGTQPFVIEGQVERFSVSGVP